jgi:phosphate transport system substrate-binding protein
MKKMKRIVLTVTILALFFTGCATGGGNEIVVVSREDGSGTRGAFIELFGIEEKDANGNKVDNTTDEAIVVNSTSIVMTTVAGNKNAIGYISLGSLNDTVKAVKVDGIEPTVENIKNNTYKVFRPFNIATRDDISELAQDFISFILSSDGQKVVEENSYIAASEKGPYSSTKPSGKIVIAGSSSVTPLMEKLKEAYLKVNTNAEIEIQASDSTTGMKLAMEGNMRYWYGIQRIEGERIEEVKANSYSHGWSCYHCKQGKPGK